jgi:hypothetical protein
MGGNTHANDADADTDADDEGDADGDDDAGCDGDDDNDVDVDADDESDADADAETQHSARMQGNVVHRTAAASLRRPAEKPLARHAFAVMPSLPSSQNGSAAQHSDARQGAAAHRVFAGNANSVPPQTPSKGAKAAPHAASQHVSRVQLTEASLPH